MNKNENFGPQLNRRTLVRNAGLIAAAAVASGPILAACGGDDEGSSSAQTTAGSPGSTQVSTSSGGAAAGSYEGLSGKRIGLAGVAVSSEAPARVAARAQALADEHGFTLEVYDGDGDYKRMSDTMNAWALDGIDAMVSDVVSPSLIEEGMAAAEGAGIPVGGIFAGYAPGLAFDVASNEWISAGKIGTYVVERMGGKGQIALLNWPNVPALQIRQAVIEAMLQYYEEIEIVASEVLTVPGQVPDAQQKTQSILTAHPELKCIWGGWDEVAFAASQAVIQQGRENDVFCVGIDGNEASFDAIRNGEPFSATCANDMEQITDVCFQQLGVMLQGGQPVSTQIWVDAPFVAQQNVPASGKFPVGQGLTVFYQS